MEKGPLSSEEITVATHHRFNDDIRKMVFRSSNGCNPGKQQSVLYYLPEHEPELVIRRYIEKNPTIKNLTQGVLTNFFSSHGPEFREKWRELADEYNVESAGGNKDVEIREKPCPICQDDMHPSLIPDHIAETHS